MRNEMEAEHIRAFMSLPIRIRGEIAMYLFFAEKTKNRIWRAEDVKFASDVAKILQSMLDRRIARNSMASSYQSLTEILNMVGSCVYVTDMETGEVLFVNDLLKRNFEEELAHGTLNQLLDEARPIGVREGFYELHHLARKRWYDMHYKYINWVDGRKVAFCALYDITDKKLYQRKIEQQAYTDFLTGLYNRMCCERDLALQIEHAKQENKPGGLLYLDLDDFKHINDGLGHQYGDVLLKSISNNLQRIEGIQNSCYRMGGDEFVIIVPPESFGRFEAITEEIKAIFAKPWFLKDADYYCTMSMGICYFPENGEDVQDLIKKADIAMYEAKKTGKNRVAAYSDNISTTSGKRLDMEKNMRNATTDGYREFEVYYQPIIDIQKEGTPCTGAEALVRWNSAAFGFIPPSDFIPLAEYLGLINPIGNHVMREACRACKYWNDHGHPEYKVNVNLSVVQLLQTDIVEIVKRTLDETGINPRNLTLEVTESLAINDMERMKEILNKIREHGVRIALDDFGTGYSSLNHIREIPLDVIKVDQSFVEDLAEDSYSQSFIKMVAELAGAIGVSICIEGIETREQYKVLEGMQVRLVQGYYFDKPMPRGLFEEKYLCTDEKPE
ncbi:MAG: EAL domain-containing protein [Lachnospiraceae bacterium]|nr:EAL domain-containing protein [Lachnospiraceae bacterium]